MTTDALINYIQEVRRIAGDRDDLVIVKEANTLMTLLVISEEAPVLFRIWDKPRVVPEHYTYLKLVDKEQPRR